MAFITAVEALNKADREIERDKDRQTDNIFIDFIILQTFAYF